MAWSWGSPSTTCWECGFKAFFDRDLYDRHLGFYSKFYDCSMVEALMAEILGPRLRRAV